MLPGQLERLEAQLAELQAETTAPEFYQLDHEHISERLAALQTCEDELEAAMERWVELEAMQAGED